MKEKTIFCRKNKIKFKIGPIQVLRRRFVLKFIFADYQLHKKDIKAAFTIDFTLKNA